MQESAFKPRRSRRKRANVSYVDDYPFPILAEPPRKKPKIVLRIGKNKRRITKSLQVVQMNTHTQRIPNLDSEFHPPVVQKKKPLRLKRLRDRAYEEDEEWNPVEERLRVVPPLGVARKRRRAHTARQPVSASEIDVDIDVQSTKKGKYFTVRRSQRKRKAMQYNVLPDVYDCLTEHKIYVNRLKIGDTIQFKKTKKAVRSSTGVIVNIFHHYTIEYMLNGVSRVYTGLLTPHNARGVDSAPLTSLSPSVMKSGFQFSYLCEGTWVQSTVKTVEREFAVSHLVRKKSTGVLFTEEELRNNVILPNHKSESKAPRGPKTMPLERKIDQILFREFRELNGAAAEVFLVKFLHTAYIHCDWITAERIISYGGQRKLKNFRDRERRPASLRKVQRITRMRAKMVPERHLPYFNLDYLRVESILDENVTLEGSLFQVKWGSLAYDCSTWEKEGAIRGCEGFAEALRLFYLVEKIPSSVRRSAEQFARGRPRELDAGQVFKGKFRLKSYQLEGRRWLVHNYHAYTPCILADEMGLGKTVQTVSFVEYLVNQLHNRSPVLIVAPLSTLGHWQREFRGWTDLNVVVYHGNQESRQMIQQSCFHWQHGPADVNRYNYKFNVLITTSQLAIKDYSLLSSIHWECLIVDEAHSLKSPVSQVYQKLFSFKKNHCVLLTGTPIQNNMHELWSLLHFLDPQKFPSERSFVNQFSRDNLASTSVELRASVLNPRLLQRSKALVEPDLLTREEKIIWVELTLLQKTWYKALYEQNYEKLANIGGSAATKTSLMNISMELRKCCNHPFLLKGCEETVCPLGTPYEHCFESLISASGKLVLLDKLLPKLQAEGHRVLIFSQMSKVLDIIEEYLRGRQYDLERIDGTVTGSRRQEAIDRFQRSDDCFAFLLTTRAGGVGINLMAADTVIIFDSDWNPMNDLQAIARAHRIGQKKQVNVYRLVTRNCYEQEMFRRADRKRALNCVVLGKVVDHTKKQIDAMLRQGAVALMLDKQIEKDIRNFENASIEDILAKRTEKIVHNTDSEGSLFSQAVFVADQRDTNVDINDKNFWDRVGLKRARPIEPPSTRRRRTRINYCENEYYKQFVVNVKSERDDDYSPVEAPDEVPGVVRALQQFPWGEWAKFATRLTPEEQCWFPHPKTLRVGALQTFAHIMTAGTGAKAWLNMPIAGSIVRDEDLLADIETEFARAGLSVAAAPAGEKRTKGDELYLKLKHIPQDYIDSHALQRQCATIRLDTMKSNCARMFTLKSALVCVNNDLMKLNLKDVNLTKKLPKWWSAECDRFLLQGCLRAGWGAFSEKEAKKDGLECLVQKCRAKYEMQTAETDEKQSEETEQLPESEFKWLNPSSQWNRLSSICVVLKKHIKAVDAGRRRELRAQQRREREERQKSAKSHKRELRDLEIKKRRAAKDLERRRKKNERERLKKLKQQKEDAILRRQTLAATYDASEQLTLSALQVVLCLGDVRPSDPQFHDQDFIYPIGYACKVLAPSTLDVKRKCWYVTKILRVGGVPSIRFVVTAEDRPEWMLSAPTANGVWKKVSALLDKALTIVGEDQMGLTHPAVREAVELLPGAESCPKYRFRTRSFHCRLHISPLIGKFRPADFAELEKEKFAQLRLLDKFKEDPHKDAIRVS